MKRLKFPYIYIASRWNIFIFALLISFNFSSVLFAQGELNWLKLSKISLQNWKADYTFRNGIQRLEISPDWPEEKQELLKTIYSIVPKKSSSYVLATNKLLEVLYSEGIRANITIRNFSKNKDEGLSALKEAEALNADLIFTMGSEAAALVHENYKNGKIQVVTSTNKDPVLLGQVKDYEHGSKTNIATTTLNIPVEIQLNYLKELIPGLKNIALMYNRNHKQVMATEVVPARKNFTEKNYRVLDVVVDSPDSAVNMLSQAIPKAIKQMKQTDPDLSKSVFWITSSTSIFSNMETVVKYTEKVPVVSSVPNAVKEGDASAVLAIGIDRRNNAHLASIYAVKILKDEAKAGDLKVGVVAPPDIALNFKIARKIGLKIPFHFFESAAFIYDYSGKQVRAFGEKVKPKGVKP